MILRLSLNFSDSGAVNVPLPIISGTIQDNNRARIHNINFISAFDDYIRETGGINSNHSTWFTNNFI